MNKTDMCCLTNSLLVIKYKSNIENLKKSTTGLNADKI